MMCLAKVLLDLAVTRDRLGNARVQVAIPIVLGAVADQLATHSFEGEGPDEVRSLHETRSSPTFLTPGITPPVRS